MMSNGTWSFYLLNIFGNIRKQPYFNNQAITL